MASALERVVEHFQGIVEPDGGELEWIELAGGVARFSYLPGNNEKCVTCVLTPEDLKELILEAIRQQDNTIASVEIVVRESPHASITPVAR